MKSLPPDRQEVPQTALPTKRLEQAVKRNQGKLSGAQGPLSFPWTGPAAGLEDLASSNFYRQGGLECCDSGGRKESERLNWTELLPEASSFTDSRITGLDQIIALNLSNLPHEAIMEMQYDERCNPLWAVQI